MTVLLTGNDRFQASKASSPSAGAKKAAHFAHGAQALMNASFTPKKDTEEPESMAKKAKHFANGAKELTLSKMGVGHADKATIQARRAACRVCLYRKKNKCSACGCSVDAKTARKSQYCPKGYWQKKETDHG